MQTQQAPHKVPAAAHEPVPREPAIGPIRFLPAESISQCASFRDAVRLAWENRARRGMTQTTLAELLEIKASHMSNMLNRETVDKHGKPRQDLPARYIADFERVVGNRCVAQYLARMAMLTLMEEVIAQRAS